MAKKAITEEMKLQDKWYEEARGMTLEHLPKFLKSLTENYEHDYGTICHAIAAGAIATAWSMDKTPTGGITGFQAGAVMWKFIRQWLYSNNKCGLKIVDYDDFLHPQSSYKYDKVITKNCWNGIQKEAAKCVAKADEDYQQYEKDLEQYNKDIADFVARHPDYYENKKHYDPIACGTTEEHKAEKEKQNSGFEFAPQPPYATVHPDVYKHWQSIVSGVVPFGYRVED